MTSKTYTATQTGPVTLDLSLTAGQIRVHVDTYDRAEVTVSTADDSGPSAGAVNNTDIRESGKRLTVRVPRTAGGSTVIHGGGTVIQSGGGVFIAGDNFGVIQTGRSVYVNGVQVSDSGAVVVGGAPISIDVYLPAGSSLVADTTSAHIEASGRLTAAQIRTVSGGVRLGAVDSPQVRTISGDIRIEHLHGDADLSTVSGDISVNAATPCSVRANSVSGDIRTTGARVDLDARSVSGRVRQS